MPLIALILILAVIVAAGGVGFAVHLLWLVIVAIVLLAAFAWFGARPYYSRWRGGGPPPY